MQPSRVAGEETLEEVHPVLAHKSDALVPRDQSPSRVGPREGHARDPEAVRDPVRVAELTSRGDRLLGEGEGFLDTTRRLESVDVRREAVPTLGAVAIRHLAGELEVAVEVAAVHVPQRFDERRVTRLARVVAVVGLQFSSPVGVHTGGVGPPREARIAGRRVQAGESRDVGRRRWSSSSSAQASVSNSCTEKPISAA